MRGYWKFIAPLGIASLFYILVRTTGAPEVDWTPSFSGGDNRPYGCLIVRRALNRLFSDRAISEATMSAYNHIVGSEVGVSYVIINEKFDPGREDLRALLDFVERGNTLFVAANAFSIDVRDSLGVDSEWEYFTGRDSITLRILTPSLQSASTFKYKGGLVDYFIERFDTTRGRVIAMNSRGKGVMIRIPRGRGNVILSSVPYVYTNYAMLLSDNAEFAWRTLSTIPGSRIIWDEHYKAGRFESTSPMRYVWSQTSLKGAFWIGLSGVILFVVFMGSRRQRVIPVLKPPSNTTLEFIDTVGRLYYQHGDHRDLAVKKASYFLEHLRNRYNVNTAQRDNRLIDIVAARSGVNPRIVRSALQAADMTHESGLPPADHLREVNRAIEDFYEAESAHRTITTGTT